MKKHRHRFTCLALLLFVLVGCTDNNFQSEVGTAQISNNVTAVELAIEEFNTIFSEFEKIEIIQTATSARNVDGGSFHNRFTIANKPPILGIF